MSNNMLFFFLTPEAIAVMIPIVLIGYIIWAFIWGTTFHMVIASLLLLGTIILLYYIYIPKQTTIIQSASPSIVIVPALNKPVNHVSAHHRPKHHSSPRHHR